MNLVAHRQHFCTTRWSVVLRAGGGDDKQAGEALEQLCRDYWYPIYAYVRRKGYSPEDASDLTQDFFAKLLSADFAAGLTPEGSRFRSFLLTALNRFLINEWQKGQRAKRGGGKSTFSLDQIIAETGEASYVVELAISETPEHLYQRAWAETMLQRVLKRLSDECAARGDGRFDVLRSFLATDADPPSLLSAAEQLGLSLPAFKSLLHRFRQRYRELLLDEVSQTVTAPCNVAEELRGLLVTLRGD